MALSPYELAIKKAKTEKQERLRQQQERNKTLTAGKDPLMADVERRLESIRQEAKTKRKTTTTQSSAGSGSLIICKSCNQPVSKRADKCPKCGHGGNTNCHICKASIPKSSRTCPECGDPNPFETHKKQLASTSANFKRGYAMDLMNEIEFMNVVTGIAEEPMIEKIYLDLSGRSGYTNPHSWCREPQVDLSCMEIMRIFKSIDRIYPGLVQFKKASGFLGFMEQPHLKLTSLGESAAEMLRNRKR